MKSISLCVAFLVVSFLFAQPGFAQKKKTSGKKAVVITQGAQIYEKPDFDANVIGTVQAGKSVVVSSGTYGAFVKFYKIRVGKTLGYIADIDVKVAGKSAAGKSAKTKTQSSEKKPSKKSAERERKEPKPEPLYFSRFIGLDVGKIWFKEGISGIDAKEGLLTYGLRVTGPDVLLEGAILDWNLILHYGAPSYYDQLSATKPAGFVLWTDA
ncbi:MAG TPA: hypothetical protein VM432_01710, partial [Bdellovibrionales bacterium]|nr:hypothetical protein [Bdellovibrionales bacterium]